MDDDKAKRSEAISVVRDDFANATDEQKLFVQRMDDTNARNNPKNNAKRSAELVALKRAEMDAVISGNVSIPPTPSDSYVDSFCRNFLFNTPLGKILREKTTIFYVYFALKRREIPEGHSSFTTRGGSEPSIRVAPLPCLFISPTLPVYFSPRVTVHFLGVVASRKVFAWASFNRQLVAPLPCLLISPALPDNFSPRETVHFIFVASR